LFLFAPALPEVGFPDQNAGSGYNLFLVLVTPIVGKIPYLVMHEIKTTADLDPSQSFHPFSTIT
jgi:hypothetical protein